MALASAGMGPGWLWGMVSGWLGTGRNNHAADAEPPPQLTPRMVLVDCRGSGIRHGVLH